MNKEEIEQLFEIALEEFEQECKKAKYAQKEIMCDNKHGVFINFAGIEVNYSTFALADDNVEYYLHVQEEKHNLYHKVLQEHRLKMRKEWKSFNSVVHSLIQRWTKPSAPELEKMINQTRMKISFDKVLTEGARLGNYFFREEVGEVPAALQKTKNALITHTENIYENAKDLYSADQDRLQYFRNKYSLWYEKNAVE
ncbi:MAG: hypothetical protein Q8R47_02315 [Nanoarchaeota archaeon]|nr:hypothetical protein [Nanoarchaeota archaeon]